MRIGVVDVGSNTARLLVAEVSNGDVRRVVEEGAFVGLGADLAHAGTLTPARIESAALHARRFARQARALDVAALETIVTAPGRGGDGAAELVAALSDATGRPARVLDADTEGRLAWDGAVSREDSLPDVVCVVDVGGGSTEIVAGTPLAGPAWVRSLELGSLRLTRLALAGDPPTREELELARREAHETLRDVAPPRPDLALAAGGSARAVAKVLGRTFDANDLDLAVQTLARRPAARNARTFGVTAERAETLVAGATILAEVARTLDVPLRVARGGLREGVALAVAAAVAAAA